MGTSMELSTQHDAQVTTSVDRFCALGSTMLVAIVRSTSYVDEVPSASFLVLGISYEVLIARTEYYGQRIAESNSGQQHRKLPANRRRCAALARLFTPIRMSRSLAEFTAAANVPLNMNASEGRCSMGAPTSGRPP
jgi:hypothetical protein